MPVNLWNQAYRQKQNQRVDKALVLLGKKIEIHEIKKKKTTLKPLIFNSLQIIKKTQKNKALRNNQPGCYCFEHLQRTR